MDFRLRGGSRVYFGRGTHGSLDQKSTVENEQKSPEEVPFQKEMIVFQKLIFRVCYFCGVRDLLRLVFQDHFFCVSMNRKKNRWKTHGCFSAEVMSSKILIDEFQYEEDLCLNFGPVMQKQKSNLEDFTSIQTFQDGKKPS